MTTARDNGADRDGARGDPLRPPEPAGGPPLSAAEERFTRPAVKFALWTGVLGGAVAWSAQLLAGYALSRFSHEHRWLTGVHHAVSAAAEFLIMGAWIALHELDEKHALDVTLAGGFWYWVAGTGAIVYAVLFWGPRVL